MIQYDIILYCIISYYIILYDMIWYNIIWYCIILYYILYYIILYYMIWCDIIWYIIYVLYTTVYIVIHIFDSVFSGSWHQKQIPWRHQMMEHNQETRSFHSFACHGRYMSHVHSQLRLIISRLPCQWFPDARSSSLQTANEAGLCDGIGNEVKTAVRWGRRRIRIQKVAINEK